MKVLDAADDGSSLFGFFGSGSVLFLPWRVCNVHLGSDVVEYLEELSPRTLSRDTIVLQILICHQHHVIPVGLFKVRRIFMQPENSQPVGHILQNLHIHIFRSCHTGATTSTSTASLLTRRGGVGLQRIGTSPSRLVLLLMLVVVLVKVRRLASTSATSRGIQPRLKARRGGVERRVLGVLELLLHSEHLRRLGLRGGQTV